MKYPIYAREFEKKKLKNILDSERPEFIAIYGRRRIGKTFLVRQFFNEISGVKYLEITGKKDAGIADQIDNFCRKVEEIFGLKVPMSRPKKWKDAINQLNVLIKDLPKKEKVVVFFDELPWLASPKSGLLQAVDYIWNTEWNHNPQVKLIVCGSAAAWIISKVINGKGGLHNRLTDKILLKPLDLKETKEYLEKKNKVRLSVKDLLLIYMSIGGIPLYLDYIIKGRTAIEAINDLCFSENGLLFSEFENIFQALFESSKVHVGIIKAISTKRKGITRNELLDKIKLSSGGYFNKIMQELVSSGFVEEYVPFGKIKKDIVYRLSDEYCYFYLHWIEKNKHSIKKTKNYWHIHGTGKKFNIWSGYAFETVMLKHSSDIANALGIQKLLLEVGSWHYTPKKSGENGAQIDMLFDRADSNITVVELKFHEDEFAIDKKYAEELDNKLAVFKEKTGHKKTQYLAFLTISGVKKNQYYNRLVDREITVDEIF